MNNFWRPSQNLFRKLKDIFEIAKRKKVVLKEYPINGDVLRDKIYQVKKGNKWRTPRSILTRWTPLGAAAYTVWLYNRNIEDDFTGFEIACYEHLPLRIVSKIWGKIASVNLPISARSYVYGKFSNMFEVNIAEAQVEDFEAYDSLADFFVRLLKPTARIIDESSCLVSPCDGKILHCGPARSDKIEQVKGVTYTLEEFFGRNDWSEKSNDTYYNSLLKNKENILHQCVLYLAPGDYHRFHSPCSWKAKFRRHFSGKLLSVNPVFAKLIPGLFCLNERVVYVGEWKYGFFSFTPVGATNVGSIEIYKDSELKTNKRKKKHSEDLVLDKFDPERGEMLGQFNMGSTIVLIFEAPKDFQFSYSGGDKIKMGQPLGCAKN